MKLWLGLLWLALPWLWQHWQFYPFWLVAGTLTWITHTQIEREKLTLDLRLLGVALVACICFPLDDDAQRYFWEGEFWWGGGNPYLTAPNVSTVNHPEWTAIYGPLFIEISGWMGLGPLSLRVGLVVLHLLNAKLIDTLGHSKAALHFLYSPLILIETIGLGHMEQLLVTSALCVALGIAHSGSFITCLGHLLGFWIKWWMIPFIPFVIKRHIWPSILITLVGSIIILYPFWHEPLAMTHSLFAFEAMRSHGWVRMGLDLALGEHGALILVVAILCFRYLQAWFLGGHFTHQLWLFMRVALWLTPTLHPWYLILPLTLALIEGHWATFTLASCFAFGLHDGEFSLQTTGQWVTSLGHAWPLFLILFTQELQLRRWVFRKKGEPIAGISIITPIKNEAHQVEELETSIQAFSGIPFEWIVVDGGSTDGSINKVKTGKVIPSAPGRGLQISAGLKQAQYNWILIHHADTRLPPTALIEISKHVSRLPNLVGGAFAMRYRQNTGMGLLTFLNDFKTRWLGISFGDQSQFFKKSSLRQGFPNLELMEDLELSLQQQGQMRVYIQHLYSKTSNRRWRDKGRLRNSLEILHFLFQYLWRRQWWKVVDVRTLYRRYYA